MSHTKNTTVPPKAQLPVTLANRFFLGSDDWCVFGTPTGVPALFALRRASDLLSALEAPLDRAACAEGDVKGSEAFLMGFALEAAKAAIDAVIAGIDLHEQQGGAQ
ncbi:hypothetical protein ACIOWK_32785 [Pseudomonas protegens]|uniref:hypothetical protein n=1 Tax=Pseudomonas protegens TaxID=380021 RepID=UPI0037F4C6E9